MSAVIINDFQPSSTSSVALIGGVIHARHLAETVEKKYPRNECPVCEGKGWYISGDRIEKVDCGYCEPVKTKDEPQLADPQIQEEEEDIDEPPLVPIPKQFILRK